jgi:hypothetical protein
MPISALAIFAGLFTEAGMKGHARFAALLFVAVAVAACQSSNPADQSLEASEDAAIVLMKVNPAPLEYSLNLSTFDEKQQALTANSFSGYTSFGVEPGNVYVARKIAPGTHVFAGFIQQYYWTGCFQSATLAFDVKPGEILYLGEYNPLPHFLAMQTHVKENRDFTASSNDRHFYFDNIPPVRLAFGSDRAHTLSDVSDYVKAQMPKVVGTVALAEYRDAKFGNGISLFGQPVCGGYYKGKAE